MKISSLDNLWKIFKVSPKAKIGAVDRAYKRLRRLKKYEPSSLRASWKIIRDPYFSKAYNHYLDTNKIFEAGFFDDGVEPEQFNNDALDPLWLTTPVYKILNNLEKYKRTTSKKQKRTRFVVLLTTGSLAPIHNAHITMMEAAKKELEKDGNTKVLGGYLSPSHDNYVSTKYNGEATMNIAKRTQMCETAISQSDWLMLDPWEGRFNKVSLTYTDVIERLKKYLSKHIIEVKIDIVYVFGSDNAAFARAFINKGQCVCVKRFGYTDKLELISKDPALSKNKNIIIAISDSSDKDISSSTIRAGKHTHIPETAKELFFRFTRQKNKDDAKNIYAIRNDLSWATKDLQTVCDNQKVNKSIKIFTKEFLESIVEVFSRDKNCGKATPVLLDLNQQQNYLNSLQETPVINLDACTKSKYKINLSRLFGISDGQCHSHILTPRPYYPSLKQQLERIPDGEYILVDDDIATGRTQKTIMESLPNRIKIKQTETLLDHSLTQEKLNRDEVLDVVDIRDFVIGSKDAGLVVSLPNGQTARAPYMLPYVSLITRAKIPPLEEFNFSLKLWEMNERFFSSLDRTITLRETSPSFQKLMKYIGFKPSSPLAEICRWHIQKLDTSIKRC